MPRTIIERVAAGAAVLDKHIPGWEAKIDTDTLNIGSDMHCMLGQLYGEYIIGVHGLKQFGVEESMQNLGFLSLENSGNPSYYEYRELTIAWHAAIDVRRESREPARVSILELELEPV